MNSLNRRQLLSRTGYSLGAAALSTLLTPQPSAAASAAVERVAADYLRFAPKAKRIIFLFMQGGVSHIDTFDFKPAVRKFHGVELPDSIRQGQRVNGLSAGQASFPCVAPMFDFQRHGECGGWVSELLPHTASIIDDITVIKSIHTEAVNHTPAQNLINTAAQIPGRPSLGAWLSYGLGTETESMPAYVVLISSGGTSSAISARSWGSGFLPAQHQGVRLRSGQEAVLYLSHPKGMNDEDRRRMLNGLAELNRHHFERAGNPETEARIKQYELAFQMQMQAPEILDVTRESESTFALYGDDARKPGTFAANCLRARRMTEAGVRFVQLFHRGWDQHSDLPRDIRSQSEDTDRASAALVKDLKQRGLLDDTLVVWASEFGRTIYSEGQLTPDNHGRDHHGGCFTIWMAGGGIRAGFEYGKTDEFCYNILDNPVHVRDVNATILNLMGIDHNELTYPYQGLQQRPTGVNDAYVVDGVLA
jgi:uncharacterized protein (DUF1501 family)